MKSPLFVLIVLMNSWSGAPPSRPFEKRNAAPDRFDKAEWPRALQKPVG
jgi:hypothetical protein